jgi:hypothetical protein
MSEYVSKGAIMTCTCGAAPSQLEVTSNTFYYIQGKLAATTADKVPMVNIKPFGTCTIRPSPGGLLPCTPAPTAWSGFVASVQVGRAYPILNTSTIQCTMGGVISFENSGQMKPNKVKINPNSPQIDALIRAAKEAKMFCEVCEEIEEQENPEILRVYWMDENDEPREIDELMVKKPVTICIEVENGAAGETLDITIEAPEGKLFEGGEKEKNYFGVVIENDNTAYINDFSFEYQK